MATKQQMLDAVETAISKLDSGVKSYTVNGRTVTYRDLAELREMRKELKRELSSTRTNTTYAKFEDPS